MMFKDSQMDYIFKKEKPNLSLNDFITSVPSASATQKDKKFRVRALLKCTKYQYTRKEIVCSLVFIKKKGNLSFQNEY